MKKLFGIFFFGFISFVQTSWSQHPQLKMLSIPKYFYDIQTKSFNPLPSNSLFNGYNSGEIEGFHNIMYKSSSREIFNGHPYDTVNKIWFFVGDNNIFYKDGTLICSLNNGSNVCDYNSISPDNPNPKDYASMLTGEVCIVPVPDKFNHPNEFYVITPRDYTRLHPCESSNCNAGEVRFDVNNSQYPPIMYNLSTIKDSMNLDVNIPTNVCHWRYFFLAASKEFLLDGVPTRYLFRFCSHWGISDSDQYKASLDVFKITGNGPNDGISYVTSFSQYRYFNVGWNTVVNNDTMQYPHEYPYISEMELVSNKSIDENDTNNLKFRLALPYLGYQKKSTNLYYGEIFPGIKVFEFDRDLNVLDNKEYNFRRVDATVANDNLLNHKINGLEFSPDGKYLFFNFSKMYNVDSSVEIRKLVYVYLNDYGSLPSDAGNYYPASYPNTIPLKIMPVPTLDSNFHHDYAQSFIEWGWDKKLYYVNNHNYMTVNFQNISDYNPNSLIDSCWDTIPIPYNPDNMDMNWDIALYSGSSSGYNCTFNNYNQVYVLPDQIDGEDYDNDTGCCLPSISLPDAIILCACDTFNIYTYLPGLPGLNYDFAVYDYGDGTILKLDHMTSPSPHIYNQLGSFKYKISLYLSCGTVTDSTIIVVIDCRNDFDFSDTTICQWDNYEPNFHYTNINFPNRHPKWISYSWGDNIYNNGGYDVSLPWNTSPDPHHYAHPGSYNVTITVDWGCGTPVSKTRTIIVNCCTNNFDFSDTTICQWDNYEPNFHFTNIQYPGHNPLSINYNYGDGIFGGGYNVTLPGVMSPAPYHYSHTGTYPMTITLDWGCGYTINKTKNVHVICCTDSFDFDTVTICVNSLYTPSYHFINSNNPNPFSPDSMTIDFGDMTLPFSESLSNNPISPIHYYTTPGVYRVCLTFSWEGCHRTVCHNLNVICCTRNFDFNHDSICLGNIYRPYIRWKNLNDPNPEPLAYTFNFGDGTIMSLSDGDSANAPSHLYNNIGTYPVIITLDWGNGCMRIDTNYLTVKCCTKKFDFDSGIICVNGFYLPNYYYTPPYNSNPEPSSITYNFGNGYTTTVPPFNSPNPPQYISPGVYTVTITLNWGINCSKSVSHKVKVRPSGTIPNLTFPDTTICVNSGCSPCKPRWKGPIEPYDFNADHFKLIILDANNEPIDSIKEDVPTYKATFDTNDIFYESFPNDTQNKCKLYHYQLFLSNCDSTKSFSGIIYVNGCFCYNNICRKNCCTRNFDFKNDTVCINELFTQHIKWLDTNNYKPLPLSYTINYGNLIITNLITDTNITMPFHSYSIPGFDSVTITINWGNGCTESVKRYILVRGGFPFDTSCFSFPHYTKCIGPPPCKSKWEGPTCSNGGDFNAYCYGLYIWHYVGNIAIYEHKFDTLKKINSSINTNSSYKNGDIFYEFSPDSICKLYHYQLTLTNCNDETHTFYGIIHVSGCDTTNCDTFHCESYNSNLEMMMSPDNIKNGNKNENIIKIYPNPTKDKFYINVHSVKNLPLEYEIQVQDILSKSLQNFKSVKTDLFTLDLSPYSKGMYLIKIITKNREYIYKEVKE